jgi:hypothetical protein
VNRVGKVMEAVDAGRADKVPALVTALTAAERKECLEALRKFRKELAGWPWRRWREQQRARAAVVVAGTALHGGAAGAALWISTGRGGTQLPQNELLAVLEGRGGEWLGDLAHRLAARPTAEQDHVFIRRLVELAGCAVPVTDGLVTGWTAQSILPHRLDRDPWTPVFVPHLFELRVLPPRLVWSAGTDGEGDSGWAHRLARLTETGQVERKLLIDRCVSRLLRGGPAGEARFLLVLLKRLTLDGEELRERVPDWLGMVADGGTPVAAHAQEALGVLAEGGALSGPELAEFTRSALFRSEKKLVNRQLVLAGRILRGCPASAGELLPAVAEVFGDDDITVQGRALKLVARWYGTVGEDVRAGLAAAAAALSPLHRETAAGVFGDLLDPADGDPWGSAPYQEFLPPVAEAGPVPAGPGSAAELVGELLSLRRGAAGAAAFDGVLDGLVRLGSAEPEELRRVLGEATEGRSLWFRNHLQELVAAVLHGTGVQGLHEALVQEFPRRCAHERLEALAVARVREAAYRLLTRPLPFLLATPDRHTGELAAETLVERLAEYRRLGVDPAPVDFGQALLRVARGGSPVVALAAARLGTREGDRLAAHLAVPGPAGSLPGGRSGAGGETPGSGDGGGTFGPAVVRQLLQAPERVPPCRHWDDWDRQWPTVLPHDREAVALWLLPLLTDTEESRAHRTAALLPWLAETPAPAGPAGPLVHRALAASLGTVRPDDRLAAVDLMLQLAARGQLDPRLLGRELAGLLAHRTVKLNRVTDALATAAATGAHGTVWSVLGSLLPALVPRGGAVRGLGALLTVAADCVEQCGPVWPLSVPESAARADDGGTGDFAAGTGAFGSGAGASGTGGAAETGAVSVSESTTLPAAMPTSVPASATAAPAEVTGTARDVEGGPGLRPGGGPEVAPGAEGSTTGARSATPPVTGVRIPGLAELAARGGSSLMTTQAARLVAALRPAPAADAGDRARPPVRSNAAREEHR